MTKRVLDLILAILLIFILLIPGIIIAILIFIKLGKPVLFKQPRPGLHNIVFTMYKFRTMTDSKDLNGNIIDDKDRLTKFGRWLRNLSIDEWPELINILKGDMSFVGPRPLLVEYLALYSDIQKRRHEVKPGITGWAQVNGRNAISWDDKFKLDIWYIDNISFVLDMKIILMTLVKVMMKKDITKQGYVTTDTFNGKN